MRINDKIKSNCRACNRETNHIVKAMEVENFDSDEFSSREEFSIVQCLGCETIAFRSEYTDSESGIYDQDSYDEAVVVKVYPPVAVKGHKRLEDQYLLPAPISLMYNESIDALTAGCKTLAGAGFRAVIEAVCLNKQITGDDLEDKINNLARHHYITPGEKSRLHSIRFLGNDSVHEMRTPKDEQLALVLQIIEHLLRSIYLIDAQVQERLESIITDYEVFKERLTRFVMKLKTGDEASLYKLFGKEVRRIKEHGQAFETQLVTDINTGAFTLLTIVPAPTVVTPGKTAPSSPVFRVV